MPSEKKTKILAIGDIHGNQGLIKRLAEKAKKQNIDLVILAGDLTMFEDSTKNLIGPFTKAKKPVLIIPGNHETASTIEFITEKYPNVRNIHGGYYKKGDLGIFGAGGGDVVIITPDKEIFYLLEKSHEKIKNSKKKIMVTHMHPAGSKSEFSGFPGSKSVREAIMKFKPDILINAHIHEAGGIEEKIQDTKVINVSKKEKIFKI